MNINLHFVQTRTYPRIASLVYKKLENLEKKFNWIINAEVFFQEEKNTYGKGKICEIRLSVPGSVIYASSDEASFEAAVAETAYNLERKLKSHKEKWESQRHSSIKTMA
ncbi:MAG: ribosome-associated translation inhibitor RaiA [Bacteroidota bacterium]|nr:ribosome-associated translation inhibitor RaiA [Bacteroidota bacterium]